MATVGEAIDAKVQEYITLYESLKADPEFGNSAANLAKHDLFMAVYINTQALERLEQYISGGRQNG